MIARAAAVLVAAGLSLPASAGANERDGVRHFSAPGSMLPFSAAVRAGDLIFSSGQIGVRQGGTVPIDMGEGARLAMDAVGASLALAGAGYDDIVKCTVMLADMRQWAAFNRVYATYFRPGRLPARSAMGVSALAFGASVEVECIAYKPVERGR